MSPEPARPVGCVLGDRHPCPPECRKAGGCVVIRIRQRNDVERTGVPLALVGETLRFLQVLPQEALLLLPLGSLEPLSAELAISRAPAPAEDRDR